MRRPLLVLPLLALGRVAPARAASAEPPDAPAQVEEDHERGRLVMRYDGAVLLDAAVRCEPSCAWSLATKTSSGDKTTQELRLRPKGAHWGARLRIEGAVSAGEEAFAAETPSAAQKRFPLVRNSAGASFNLRNNAVYDRGRDWVLYGPGDGATRVLPEGAGRFSIAAQGKSVALTFKPRFYQRHKNLRFFQPWTYRVWPESVAGWSSWWAYRDDIDEKTIARVAEVFAGKLRDFGYEYIQVDDGYQSRTASMPKEFLETNERFPSGLKSLAASIAAKGLKPALWVSVHFRDKDFALAHPGWFVEDGDGKPHKGPWIGYAVDGSSSEALDAVVRPLYRGLKEAGWRYVKIDTLRHLLYDAIYPCRGYFNRKGVEGEEAFRRVLAAAREELGRGVYVLACWGVLPEAAGIADASRLGTDGFGPATLQQYTSWNNVVWRNDPDHIDIGVPGEDVIRPVLASMAGAQLMLSDKAEVYADDARIEGARRSAPVLFTRPGQLYDFDPRKTDQLIRGKRNSGGGAHPGPIDAEQTGKICPWWLLEIDKPFEHWSVLARFSWDKPAGARTVRFADLGLPPGDYLVYEFWGRRFVGEFKDAFPAAAQKAKEVRVYALRAKLDRPQILSTSRHVSQGGVDLAAASWDASKYELSGRSLVVAGDPYVLTLYAPQGFAARQGRAGGGAAAVSQDGSVVTLAWTPAATGPADWSVLFHRR